MRCFVTLMLVLSPSVAAADMLSPIPDCPPGQMSVPSLAVVLLAVAALIAARRIGRVRRRVRDLHLVDAARATEPGALPREG